MIRRPVSFAGLVIVTWLVAITPGNALADQPGTFEEVNKPGRLVGSWSARLVAPVRVTGRPQGGRIIARLGTATSWSRHPQSLLVLDKYRTGDGRQFLKVLLPVRPVGASGWIPRNRVVLTKSNLWIEIHKWNRRLIVFRGGDELRRQRIVIGADGTPTPAGIAAVWERNPQPNPRGFIGPWTLPLTLLSRRLKNYGGGPGRIALHGRAGASFRDPLGSAASNGCIRMTNRSIRWLARIAPPGTPVVIRNRPARVQ